MFHNNAQRLALLFSNVFLSLTAMAGGLALIMGWLAPPAELLVGSPFRSYTIPGLALLVLVGGSALVASVALWRGHKGAIPASLVAGLMILGFEGVEVVMVGSPDLIALRLQLFYVMVGLLILALAAWSWLGSRRVDQTHV